DDNRRRDRVHPHPSFLTKGQKIHLPPGEGFKRSAKRNGRDRSLRFADYRIFCAGRGKPFFASKSDISPQN
ncbi:MAG: hypothetical protein IJ306_08210, partial [Oscillospiraceae bacterium]|nr:hypothetical protein [Oscillospiraceae bacterium]